MQPWCLNSAANEYTALQEAMGLTEDQQKFLLEARREYLREVSKLLEARRGLQATLKVLLCTFSMHS